MKTNKKKRIGVVDILTSITILLVVLGHHKFLRDDVYWYYNFDKFIYSFHMGLFMVLSGFVTSYTYPYKNQVNFNIDEYKAYVIPKLNKIIPNYFIVGVLACILKYDGLEFFLVNLLHLIISPTEGSIQIIWYIYVLLFLFAITPFIFKLRDKWFTILVIISLLLSIISPYVTTLFCLNNIFRLLFFFLMGFIIQKKFVKIENCKNWIIILLSSLFVVSEIFIVRFDNLGYTGLSYIVTSLLSLPFFYGISKLLLQGKITVYISSVIVRYNMPIYLWQVFWLNLIYLLYTYYFPVLDSKYMVLYIVISTLITIIGCICISKLFRNMNVLLKNIKN
ncbi:MAG: acyltransferase [Rikenellaceae bacterium]